VTISGSQDVVGGGCLINTRDVAVITMFAALTAVSDSISGIPQLHSGVWYSWVFLMVPLNGIVLGSFYGFLATMMGVFVGHFIYPQGYIDNYAV